MNKGKRLQELQTTMETEKRADLHDKNLWSSPQLEQQKG